MRYNCTLPSVRAKIVSDEFQKSGTMVHKCALPLPRSVLRGGAFLAVKFGKGERAQHNWPPTSQRLIFLELTKYVKVK
jgi:hypothetical protein